MGAAVGLRVDQVMPFLVSLRRSGYGGEVVLFVDRRLEKDLARARPFPGLKTIRARQWLPFKLGLVRRPHRMLCVWSPLRSALWVGLKAIGRLPLHDELRLRLQGTVAKLLYTPMEARFLRYQRYLATRRYAGVLLTDVRDVVFQLDPFEELPSNGLAVSIETERYTLASEPLNARWIRRVYGDDLLRQIGTNQVSCVGVTYGDGDSIAHYLKLFNGELLKLSPATAGVGGADTAIHNMLVWTGRLGAIHRLQPLVSPVATLNGIAEEEISLCSGRLLNLDGTIVSVLHQYDRIPRVRAAVLDSLST